LFVASPAAIVDDMNTDTITPSPLLVRAREVETLTGDPGGTIALVLVGDRVHVLDQGDVLLVPPRVPHAFGAVAGVDADVLFVFTPGTDRFDYYRLLDRVHRGEADPPEIGESQERFDNHYVDSPLWRETRS
jgi:hypothetical protein